MKKVLFSLFLSALSFYAAAQVQRGMKGVYDVDSFPTVSFIWNSPNPEELETSRFALFEMDSAVDIKVKALPVNNNETVKKSILILWEDMASHSRQSTFTKDLLIRFFQETKLSDDDRFEVVTFDRQKDDVKTLLKPLTGQFSSDRQRLKEAVANYKSNSRIYSSFPQQTDLYLAINEGLAMLKKEPADYNGILVVVTAGLNVKAAGASTEMETVRQNAIRAGVPIYVVKYPIAGNTPEVNQLAESTFGTASSSIDVAEALDNLQRQYSSMDCRLLGRDYRISFMAKGKRDGKPHTLRLMVDKTRRPIPPYPAPKLTFGQWLIAMWWLASLILVLTVCIVVLVVILVKKKVKEREAANQAIQDQMRQEYEESERRNREIVENMRREQELKEREASEAAASAQMEAETMRRTDLMHNKNLYPRLKCQAGSQSFVYIINKPCVTIGRNAENDVAFTMHNDSFDNQTVSGFHAEIVFDGQTFEIVNKSQTYVQGVVVNGQLFQRCALRGGDMIGLGEALITFYL